MDKFTSSPELDHDRIASDARQLADLVGGAAALLLRDCEPAAIRAARQVLLQARAVASSLVEDIDARVAHAAEAVRAGARGAQ